MQPRLNDDEINALINSEELSDIADGDLEIDWLHDDEYPDSDEEIKPQYSIYISRWLVFIFEEPASRLVPHTCWV